MVVGMELTSTIKINPAAFGPQGAEIVALVNQATVLTDTEIDDLDAAAPSAARYATWTTAWAAALDAARVDARYEELYSARNAAWGATRDDARYAAQGAAVALCCRDLINPDGFTQAHYDTLTQPWASVIGPAHPKDTSV